MKTTEIASSLVSVLAPFLGENMARAAVQAQLQKVSTGEAMTTSETEVLVERLGRGLVVFVGRAKTATVVDSMRSAVRLAPAPPPPGPP